MGKQELHFPKASQALLNLIADKDDPGEILEQIDTYLQRFAICAVKQFTSFMPSSWSNLEILENVDDSSRIMEEYGPDEDEEEEEDTPNA